MRALSRVTVLALALGLLGSAHALAQGRGGGASTRRPPRAPSQNAGTAGRTELPVGAGLRALGGWLDDADVLAPGTAGLGLSFGRWTSLDGGETDAPVLDVTVGVAARVQLSVSLPYYRASYADGFSANGLGDTYIVSKVQVVDASEHRLGLAVSPMLEILSGAAVSDTTLGLSRVNWALPVSIQGGQDRTRAYATAGYFSRGAVFGGGAVEQTITSRVTVAGTLSYSYSTRTSAESDLLGLSRSRTDATGAVSLQAGHGVTIFAGAGRTVSKKDQNGAKLIASAGLSVLIARRAARP